MIELNQQLCEELEITYWQIDSINSTNTSYTINREEKELLRKILLAKGITLNDEMIEIPRQDVVSVNLKNHQLIFDDVNLKDTKNHIHLAKITEMIKSQEPKKKTWYKLKSLDYIREICSLM